MDKEKVYQLKLTLIDSKPEIWRRLKVKKDTLLPDLHKIIQTSMGWTNSHLYQFIYNETFYTAQDSWDTVKNEDFTNITLDQLLSKEQEKMVYEYDFGDGWTHEIILEKKSLKDETQNYPICLGGKNACPPEDCGGIWGYENLLKIMSNPEHIEYEEMKEWYGENIDPEAFDKEEINKMLSSKDFGLTPI